MSVDLVQAALEDDDPTCPLRRLPAAAVTVLLAIDPAPRLVAHLRAVHDVACQLMEWITERYPAVTLDGETVRLGAALHDVGKALHRDELVGPGSQHELDGYHLLMSHGIGRSVAAIARDHANWIGPRVTTESVVVSLADKVWKDQRVADLEQGLVDRIVALTGDEAWSIYAALDDLLTRIGADAPRRLSFQSSYPA